ncbi:MAG: hydroxymethylglutaryl-CoA reductase [Candidatus Thorarchaeota archaeon]|nr:MAG: hydroxymethylglutaryl-CoA reductase [Candidatus Thorarchaeota archaeon]
MQIPTFLLRKLYVKGSLENVDDGFKFMLKNSISSGTAISIEPIKVNGNAYPLDAVTISSEDGEINGTEISEATTFPIKVGLDLTIHVKGEHLPAGEHTIDISLSTKEVGKLAFDVKDTI